VCMHKYVVGGSGSESIHESVDSGVAVQFAVLQCSLRCCRNTMATVVIAGCLGLRNSVILHEKSVGKFCNTRYMRYCSRSAAVYAISLGSSMFCIAYIYTHTHIYIYI